MKQLATIKTSPSFLTALLALLISCLLSGCCSDTKAKEASKLIYGANAKDRNQGAMQLSGCGSKGESSVPRLIQLLYDENVGVQSSAAFALRKIDTAEARAALDKATKKQ